MKFTAARGNVQIAYDVLGAGAPVVMLHDFGQSSGFWYEFGYVKTCLARGRKVILVDLRGHGDSSDPVDALAYGPIHCCWDVITVLDHAGIGRADVLGDGVGGRIALCMAAFAPRRVHAVAAGRAHPFAERHHGAGQSLVETWVKLVQAKADAAVVKRHRLTSNGPAALKASMASDWPDIANAVVRSRVPIQLFVGKEDPRYSLVLSFAEQSGAKVIVLPNHDYATTAAAEAAELLPRILAFFESPEGSTSAERLPPCLWSGSWV
jgi:pimeloyl-ACP methyl ester carboxylesterase